MYLLKVNSDDAAVFRPIKFLYSVAEIEQVISR